jgi:hypothetical protein
MAQYVIVLEQGYKRASMNHSISTTDPMGEEDARTAFDALRSGDREDLLPPKSGAVLLEVSATEFLRLHKGMSSLTMDRVTLTRVIG